MKWISNTVAVFLGIVVFLLILLFLAGCEDEGSPPSRLAHTILVSTDGINTGQFQYAMSTGDPITREGMRMSYTIGPAFYFSDNGLGGLDVVPAPVQSVTASGVTGRGGIMKATGRRWEWDWPKGVTIRSSVVVSERGATGQMNYHTVSGTIRAEAAYGSGGGSVVAHAGTSGVLTHHESSVLMSPTNTGPSHGISVAYVGVGYLGGSRGMGYCEDDSYLMANNIDTKDDYFRYGAPSFFTAVIKTASEKDLSRVECRSNVRTDAFPQGIDIPLYVVGGNVDGKTHVVRSDLFFPIDASLDIAYETDIELYDRFTPFDEPDDDVWNEAHYARFLYDDWMSRLDPNLYPNPETIQYPNLLKEESIFEFVHRLDTSHPRFTEAMIPDRIFRVKVIPLGAEGDRLILRPNREDLSLLAAFLESWLTDDPTYDYNGDGIVNLEDLRLALGNP